MELNNVYDLWDRFDSSDVTELELDMKGMHLKLKRGEDNSAVANNSTSAVRSESRRVASEVVASSLEEVKSGNEKTVASKDSEITGTPVKAPLVGTFYAAPSPTEEPFVKVGQKVSKGDVIGIIEAMKLMNEVVATADGEVVDIKAKDGEMVEYDQVLIVLK